MCPDSATRGDKLIFFQTATLNKPEFRILRKYHKPAEDTASPL